MSYKILTDSVTHLHVSRTALYNHALKDVKHNLIIWICKLLLSDQFYAFNT